MFELPIKANAIHNFLFCPPDKVLHKEFDFSFKPIFFIKFPISSAFPLDPFISHIYSKCSETVKYSKNILSCWHIPMFSNK